MVIILARFFKVDVTSNRGNSIFSSTAILRVVQNLRKLTNYCNSPVLYHVFPTSDAHYCDPRR
jgi:hypothetical protein